MDKFGMFNITLEGEALILAQAVAAEVPCSWARTWAASR